MQGSHPQNLYTTAQVAHLFGLQPDRLRRLCQDFEGVWPIKRGPAGRREFSAEDLYTLDAILTKFEEGKPVGEIRQDLAARPTVHPAKRATPTAPVAATREPESIMDRAVSSEPQADSVTAALRFTLERHDLILTSLMHHLMEERRRKYEATGVAKMFALLRRRGQPQVAGRDYLAEAHRHLMVLKVRAPVEEHLRVESEVEAPVQGAPNLAAAYHDPTLEEASTDLPVIRRISTKPTSPRLSWRRPVRRHALAN